MVMIKSKENVRPQTFESGSNGEVAKTSEPSFLNRWTDTAANQSKSREKGKGKREKEKGKGKRKREKGKMI
jgi:hypothetical protein